MICITEFIVKQFKIILHFVLYVTLKLTFGIKLPNDFEIHSVLIKYLTNVSSYLNERNYTHTHARTHTRRVTFLLFICLFSVPTRNKVFTCA